MRKVYAEVTRMGENDSLGHEAGDALLQVIGARLVELARRSDLLARIGGDEFAIALPDVTNALDADTVEVIAEGVETEDQLAKLRELRCDVARGFLICRPLPAAQLHELIGSWPTQRAALIRRLATAR